MADTFQEIKGSITNEAIQEGGDIQLPSTPLFQERLEKIQDLVDSSIEDHRKTLEGLAG